VTRPVEGEAIGKIPIKERHHEGVERGPPKAKEEEDQEEGAEVTIGDRRFKDEGRSRPNGIAGNIPGYGLPRNRAGLKAFVDPGQDGEEESVASCGAKEGDATTNTPIPQKGVG
jgi:hypothetical protein